MAGSKLAEVCRHGPPDAWIRTVAYRPHVAAPGDAHDLHGVVDPDLPPLLPEVLQALGDIGRRQIVEQDHRIRGGELATNLRIPKRRLSVMVAIDEDQRPSARTYVGQFLDLIRAGAGMQMYSI